MKSKDIANLQAKVEKLEIEGDKLRAQLEKKTTAKKTAASKTAAKKPAKKATTTQTVKAVAEEVQAK